MFKLITGYKNKQFRLLTRILLVLISNRLLESIKG